MLVDLSAYIYDRMPKPFGLPDVRIAPIADHNDFQQKRKSHSMKLLSLAFTEHCGTHIDAPAHFNPDGDSIDQLPLELFYLLNTIVIDLSPKEEYEVIEEAQIREGEEKAGGIFEGDLVILNTGFHVYWRTKKYLRSPFLSLSAAQYLSKKRIYMVGVDSFTLDDTRTSSRPIHLHFLRDNRIPIIEGITNLASIPNKRFKSICFPLKINGGSGSPVRLVGVFE